MRFYTRTRRRYRGIDLRGRTLYVRVLSRKGEVFLHSGPQTRAEDSSSVRTRAALVVGSDHMIGVLGSARLGSDASEPKAIEPQAVVLYAPFRQRSLHGTRDRGE